MKSKKFPEFKIVVHDRKKIELNKPNRNKLPGDVQLGRLEESNINIFCRLLAEDKIKTREEFAVFGSHLFNILFDERIKEEFKREYDSLRNQPSNCLRVVLEFTQNARDLAVLPWEYLYYPDSDEEGRGFFIATDSQLVLARHVPIKFESRKTPKPLRILIVVSKPIRDSDGKGLGIIDAVPVINSINGLKELLGTSVQIEELPQPTKTSLSKFMKNQKTPFHVVHIIAHGKYEEGREDAGLLALVDDEDKKKAAWIKDDTIADCFWNREPRLIFLHACNGAQTTSYAAFRGLALKLVYSRIPAVVAMQYKIDNTVANKFTQRFYQSLGEGKDIDLAVQDGREELGLFLDKEENYCNKAFGTPVVYLQSADGMFIAESTETEELIDLEDKAESLVPCPMLRSHKRCQGWVYPTDGRCIECGEELMKCPKCGNVMSKTKGICACGKYVAEPSQAEKKPELTKKLRQIQGKDSIDRLQGASPVPETHGKPSQLHRSTQTGRQSAGSPDKASPKR